jgi:hypothetical protein
VRNTVVAMLTASTLVAAVAATPTNAYSQVIIVVGNGYAQPNYAQPQPYPYLPPTPYQQPAPVIYNYSGGYGYPGAYAGPAPVIYNYSGGYGYPAAYAGSYNGYYNGYYRPYWGW